MLMLVSYDVNTISEGGKKRLRRIAKQCENYGQRVQNSVFELELDWAQWTEVREKLVAEIDKNVDSLRFYRLGKNGEKRIEHIGAKPSVDFEDTLIV